jgi:aerobic-type carbon monoxide dehydrogenase small subunit (CoxS/CutS family)
MKTVFILNGTSHTADTSPGTTLMDYLRAQGLASVKHGCETGECGACTVLVDDKSLNACLLLLPAVAGKTVETVEALGDHESLHPIQEAFLAEGAAQCGYCTPAMVLSVEALHRREQRPSEAQIRDALAGTLCRCTGYVKPVEAAQKVEARQQEDVQ